VPEQFKGEVMGQKADLDYLRTVEDLQWTYFSPAASIKPGQRTGQFRLGTDQLIADGSGISISMEDYAVALLDEADSRSAFDGFRRIRVNRNVVDLSRREVEHRYRSTGRFPSQTRRSCDENKMAAWSRHGCGAGSCEPGRQCGG
jgi:hypothetical protein